jgi:hypothetical protein
MQDFFKKKVKTAFSGLDTEPELEMEPEAEP